MVVAASLVAVARPWWPWSAGAHRRALLPLPPVASRTASPPMPAPAHQPLATSRELHVSGDRRVWPYLTTQPDPSPTSWPEQAPRPRQEGGSV